MTHDPFRHRPPVKPGKEAAPTYSLDDMAQQAVGVFHHARIPAEKIPRLTRALEDAVTTCSRNGEPLVTVPAVPPNTTPRVERGRAGVDSWARAMVELERRAAAGPNPPEVLRERTRPIASSVGPGFAPYVDQRARYLWRNADGTVTWALPGKPSISGDLNAVVHRALDGLIASYRVAQRQPDIERRVAELKASKGYGM